MTSLFSKKPRNNEHPKSQKREWFNSIVFAVVAATLIRWATFEAFAIPTPSMEGTQLTGDYLFVSKLHYGPRTPSTILQLPLMHQKIMGTEIPSYLPYIQIPQFRFSGFQKIKNNDIVVFNYPDERGLPLDQKTYYVKRCIGIAGDTVIIKNRKVYVNGILVSDPPHTQYGYLIQCEGYLNKKFFKKYRLYQPMGGPNEYYIHTEPAIAKEISSLPFIKKISLMEHAPQVRDPRIWDSSGLPWNSDNFGPLFVPKKGSSIALTKENLLKYRKYIELYEGHKSVIVENDELFIDGKKTLNYTFSQNYYFMMGDNRHNSEDSRYWGFVPEDHVLGKPVLVWMSTDPDIEALDLFHKIRWERIFTLIN